MIQGVIDQNNDPTIQLVVLGQDRKKRSIDVLIDTGFTGFLTLPAAVLVSLNLHPYRREEGIIGDGSTCIFEIYRGFIEWDGNVRSIDINESETIPLIGMSLLYGYRMELDIIEGGTITIRSLDSH